MDIANAIKTCGLSRVANACGVAPSTVHKWQTNNRLPRTDYTGETCYAVKIAELHGGITAAELLQPVRRVA